MNESKENAYERAVALLASGSEPITKETLQEAYRLLVIADEAGNVEAPFLLGEYAYYGLLVPKDEKEAYACYQRAADRGSTGGKSMLVSKELGIHRATSALYFAFQEAGLLDVPNQEWLD